MAAPAWAGEEDHRMSVAFQPITGRNVRVGVIGAGAWANNAHLPGWHRDSRCDIVAVCDIDRALADAVFSN